MNKRKLVISIGAALIVAIGFVFFRMLTNKSVPATKVSNNISAKTAQAERLKQVETVFQVALKIDSDLDGLIDTDEKKYGTNQTSSDTDGDSLLDKDEIFIYKTNPLKADTYGIGYDDGWGVRLGVVLKNGKIDKNQLSKIKK